MIGCFFVCVVSLDMLVVNADFALFVSLSSETQGPGVHIGADDADCARYNCAIIQCVLLCVFVFMFVFFVCLCFCLFVGALLMVLIV